jgi:hypothetical protein
MRAQEEGVVAIDQADRGGQLRLRSNLVDIFDEWLGMWPSLSAVLSRQGFSPRRGGNRIIGDFRFWNSADIVALSVDVCCWR